MLNKVLPVIAFAVAVIVLGSSAVAEPAPPVSECDLCLGVAQDDPWACLGVVRAISSDEEEIFVRIRLEGPFYESHDVTIRWVNPSGGIYHEETFSIPLPSSVGSEWWNYYVAWRGIYVAGWPPSMLPGEWHVVVFVDGEEQCAKTFAIFLSRKAADALAASIRECLSIGWIPDYPDADNFVYPLQIEVGPEAAGFRYEILYDTEESGGVFAGQEIALGPHARSLGIGGELDASGEATISVPWPGEVSTYFFQVLIATNVLELFTGSFWQSSVLRVDRPSEEEPLAANGDLEPGTWDLGEWVYMSGCVPDSSVVIEDCLDLQLSPVGLVAGPESSLNLALEGEGFVTVTPTGELQDGETGYVAYLPVNLPLRPCCEELELTGLAICYRSVTEADYIDSMQIGYLNDDGLFEELTSIEADLTSLSWDCAFFQLNAAVVPRPLVIRIWFVFGGAVPGGAGPAAAMWMGNVRVVLAPRRNPTWSGDTSPGNITCADLLTCMPTSGPGRWSCAGGFTWYCAPATTAGRVVGFLFQDKCDEDITFGKLQVLDEEGTVVWETQAGASRVRYNSPYILLGSWSWADDGYTRNPPGNYEVVLQTSIGEFRAKFFVEDRCR